MEGTLDELINNLSTYLQPCEWKLYQDLIDTQYCPENINFYDWDYIKDNIRYLEISLLLNDFENNFLIITDIVKEIIIENIKNDNRFEYNDENNIIVKWWHIEGLIKCENCGNIWDGFAQCNCY
jgi:hypothetical protein